MGWFSKDTDDSKEVAAVHVTDDGDTFWSRHNYHATIVYKDGTTSSDSSIWSAEKAIEYASKR